MPCATTWNVEVHPQLTLRRAKELVAQLLGKTATKKSPGTILLERLRQVENFLLDILPDCSPADRQLARARLARLLDQIDAGSRLIT